MPSPEATAAAFGEARGLVYQVGERRLIDGIDLRIAAQGLSLIMGANGAGKSLLLRLLHGLLRPTQGEVRWGGRLQDIAVRRRQALVFQRPVLLRRSVIANLRFALRLRGGDSDRDAEQLLAEVGLGAKARQPARLLSGGEQQRLSLARALALRPQVLFLDEPTASLDPASTQAIEDIVLRAKARGTKILFVTHDLGQARRLADEVIFLQCGRIAEQTRADQFFANPASAAAGDYLAGRLVPH
ncbi:ATP-binding cassette domain-containing protein [uncultured Thiohalocapsa sp.]|uniref:ATP-binding cassette domain-containing protein n=1 Tax=uncultured Thiohalocapsa sp. TaxID=768990 RepID=UPI0025E9F7E0|nr:ATP-binding cassette domain-containing protein [uncultured Thiohalocapsa sp.]